VAGVNLNSGFVKKVQEKQHIDIRKLDDLELLKIYKGIKRELKKRELI
jgi:hypothetical protein